MVGGLFFESENPALWRGVHLFEIRKGAVHISPASYFFIFLIQKMVALISGAGGENERILLGKKPQIGPSGRK